MVESDLRCGGGHDWWSSGGSGDGDDDDDDDGDDVENRLLTMTTMEGVPLSDSRLVILPLSAGSGRGRMSGGPGWPVPALAPL